MLRYSYTLPLEGELGRSAMYHALVVVCANPRSPHTAQCAVMLRRNEVTRWTHIPFGGARPRFSTHELAYVSRRPYPLAPLHVLPMGM